MPVSQFDPTLALLQHTKGKRVTLFQFVYHSSIGAGATVIMTEYEDFCCCFALVFSALCFESLPPTLIVCVSQQMYVYVCMMFVCVCVSAASSFSCSCCLASLENAMNSNNF